MEFTKHDKANFELFFKLRQKKQYVSAISVLKKLNRKCKNNSVISGLLGTILFESKKFKSSRYYFKKATVLNEESELASLGLFHTFIILGKENLALKELDRFLNNNKPVKYRKTIADLKKSLKDTSNKKRSKIISDILLKV